MRDLIQQEKFEIEILDRLGRARLLTPLLFIGGTMLRLCYGSERFSVDLDFWFTREVDYSSYFRKCRDLLQEGYRLRDAADKHYTILFEVSSPGYPRGLKIEMRKGRSTPASHQAIAFSRYSDTQVLVRVPVLEEKLKEKMKALIERKEIRDAFDLEFLVRRGVEVMAARRDIEKALRVIESFKDRDYRVKLGSLLAAESRRFYRKNKFQYLAAALRSKIS